MSDREVHKVDDAAGHMDGIYRYQRHIYDASRKYFLLGRDHLLRDLSPPPNGSILEIGCGTGRNLIAAARQWPDSRLYGFDISSVMLDTARQSIERAELTARVKLAQADAAGFSAQALFGQPQFDRVFLSYTLSMIPPWRAAVEQALHVVAPGGRLHIVDFGQQDDLPALFRQGLFKWLAKFSVTPRADLEAHLRNTAEAGGATLVFKRLRRGYANYAVLQKPRNTGTVS